MTGAGRSFFFPPLLFTYNDAMRKEYRKLILSGILVTAGAAEMYALKSRPDLFFPGYRLFSKKWIGALAYLTSFVPFSVWDIAAACLVILFLVSLIRALRKRTGFPALFSNTVLAASLIVFSALQGWLGNHYAPKLSREIGLEVRQYTQEELYDAAEYYLLKAAEYAPQIPRDSEGHAQKQDLRKTAVTAGASYTRITETFPVFRGSSVPVKIFSLIGEYLMYNGTIGMFMPVSGEASVPSHVPVVPLPFTMCHEAAHRLGFASEQEANFCAYLASVTCGDPYFIYSGYYSAFAYCYNSLYAADREKAVQLYHRYEDREGILLVQTDRRDTNEAYSKYDSPLQKISDEINDTYLKTFSQESGIRSYGEVTDYLIAWKISGRDTMSGQ